MPTSKKYTAYPRRLVSFQKINEETFSPTEPTVYVIEWDGVIYELLISYQPENRQTVVWGNGAIDKGKHPMPIFQRHSWGKELDFNGIWYFDPTLYLGEANLCWCYGTNARWYLKDIAYLVYIIVNRWQISLQNTLFFGSSAGGFTSICLAILLHGKALAINPQFDCRRYFSTHVKRFKKQVLEIAEELIPERISVVECIRKEAYFPSIHIIENLLSENDMKDQLAFFLKEISLCDEEGPLRLAFYRDIKGHVGLPSSKKCMEWIRQDMSIVDKTEALLPPKWIQAYD